MKKRVLIVGGSGIVGQAALKHFSALKDCEVFCVSRRKPFKTYGSTFIKVDLTDQVECHKVFNNLKGITHVVYTALFEKPDLISGWQEEEHIEINKQMLKNFFEPLESISKELQHITLLQGAKVYGRHIKPLKIPAYEGRSDLRDFPSFYWEQESYIKQKQQGKSWGWTIFRPQLIVGESIGSPMNVLPAIGVYASILKMKGRPFHYPGGEAPIREATDADLLASAIEWAGDTKNAKNETFNITNGDLFMWQNVWGTLAEAFGMEMGEPIKMSLQDEIPYMEKEWDEIRKKYHLVSPKLKEFVGSGFEYTDFCLCHEKIIQPSTPTIVSTIKLREAGFHKVIDTEIMFRKWIKKFQDDKLLPSPHQSFEM